MTRAWLLGPVALLILPFACGEDETASSAATTSGPGPTTNASTTTTTTSGGGTSGGGGDTGSGGMAQGGASGMGCEDCADGVETGACVDEFDACMAAPQGQTSDCELWWDCYIDDCINGNGGFTAACFEQCDMDFMRQANLYGPMKTCICNECGAECLPFCP